MVITNLGGESFAVVSQEARRSAEYIHQEIFSDQVYGEIHRGEVVLDVGANIGLFAKYAIDNGASKVFCFEPDPFNLEMLRENAKIHSLKKFIQVVKKGAWSKKGKREFISYESRKGSCCFIDCNPFNVPDTSNTFTLPLTTIDREMRNVERVDVIKMDIEGAEYEALKGARETIKKHKPRLAISVYHNKQDPKRIADFIFSLVPDYQTCTSGDRDEIMHFQLV